MTTWTEQNGGFTVYNVNAVAINSAGYISAGAAGVVFRSTNDGDSWIDNSGGVISAGGNVCALAIDSGRCAFAGTAGGDVIDNSQRHSETKASANASAAALMGKHRSNS